MEKSKGRKTIGPVTWQPVIIRSIVLIIGIPIQSIQLRIDCFYLGVIDVLSRRTIQLATLSFLVVGFLFTSSSAFAYWREVTVTRDVEIVTIGEPIEIVVTDVNQGTNDTQLVPQGYVIAVGDVEVVEFQYEIGVSRELLSTVNLHISVIDILIDDDDTYSHLVDIDILGFGEEAIIDLYNDVVTVIVTIRLIEPIDANEALTLGLDPSSVNVEDSVLAYESIKGQTISFSLQFELEQIQEISNNN